MYVILCYKWGRTWFWNGRDWTTKKEQARRWQSKDEADDFASEIYGPYEAQVYREDEC